MARTQISHYNARHSLFLDRPQYSRGPVTKVQGIKAQILYLIKESPATKGLGYLPQIGGQHNNIYDSPQAHDSRINNLEAQVKAAVAEKEALQEQLKFILASTEKDKAAVEEASAAIRSEQLKTEYLNADLKAGNLLLDMLNLRISALEADISTIQSTRESSSNDSVSDEGDSTGEFKLSISTFELELERDMYKGQEREALDALVVEKDLRTAAENQLAEVSTQLRAALNKIGTLQGKLASEKYLNFDLRLDLGDERDAHAATRFDLLLLQARHAAATNDRGAAQQASAPSKNPLTQETEDTDKKAPLSQKDTTIGLSSVPTRAVLCDKENSAVPTSRS